MFVTGPEKERHIVTTESNRTETLDRGRQCWRADEGGGVSSWRLWKQVSQPPAFPHPPKVCSSNGFGELSIQPNHFHTPAAQGESKIPNSSRLNQHQGAAQDSKLLSAETSWEKAAGGKAGKGYPALRDPEPGPTQPGRVTGAPWTAASLVTCGYCYSLALRRKEGWDRAWIQGRSGWHRQWHTSLSGQMLGRGCSTSKGSSSKTVCCA